MDIGYLNYMPKDQLLWISTLIPADSGGLISYVAAWGCCELTFATISHHQFPRAQTRWSRLNPGTLGVQNHLSKVALLPRACPLALLLNIHDS